MKFSKTVLVLFAIILCVLFPVLFLLFPTYFLIKICFWFKERNRKQKIKLAFDELSHKFQEFDMTLNECADKLVRYKNRTNVSKLDNCRDNVAMALAHKCQRKFGDQLSPTTASSLVLRKFMVKCLEKSDGNEFPFELRDKDVVLIIQRAEFYFQLYPENPFAMVEQILFN